MAKLDRNMINKYFSPQDSEENLWRNSIFVFDSSSLLYMYEYSDKTKTEIIENLSEKLSGRLWIPNHVAYEYLKNRERVIKSPLHDNNKYKGLKNDHISKIDRELKSITSKIEEVYKKTIKQDMHPFLKSNVVPTFKETTNEYKDSFVEFTRNIDNEIKARSEEIENLLNHDVVLEFIEQYFEVGEEYKIQRIFEIIEESNFRFPNKIAPGWEDEENKTGIQRVGDLIVWKQILDYSKEKNTPIILVTNDVKKDWCHIKERSNEKRIVRPCKELIKEIEDYSSNNFWMYTFKDFLYRSKELIETTITNETLEEVEEIYKKNIKPLIDEEISIHPEIYLILKKAAINKRSVTYSRLASVAGLNMDYQIDRNKLGEILGNISTNEHLNNRPLLSVVAWFSGKAEPSKGFYNLAENLGLYSSKQDKDKFFIDELNKVYKYWGNPDNQ